MVINLIIFLPCVTSLSQKVVVREATKLGQISVTLQHLGEYMSAVTFLKGTS